MAYKAFSPDEQESFATSKGTNISLSEDSPCASHLHFFTGVRSFGKVNVFDQNNCQHAYIKKLAKRHNSFRKKMHIKVYTTI